jgi:AraC-like DNA-binding protein
MGERTFVLQQRAREHEWSGRGVLSIKYFPRGRARYTTDEGQFLVERDAFLVLNDDQPYTVAVDAAEPAESFCVFFERGFVESLARAASEPTHALLDDPADCTAPLLSWPTRTYKAEGNVLPALAALRAGSQRNPSADGELVDAVTALALRLIGVLSDVREQIGRIPAAKQATRAELYKRLHIARDFIEAAADQPLTLAEVGRAAALSPGHLQRSFRALFGHSPHAYATHVRLERAVALLLATELPLVDICTEIGFTSVPSFVALFKRRYGVTPHAYRVSRRSASQVPSAEPAFVVHRSH